MKTKLYKTLGDAMIGMAVKINNGVGDRFKIEQDDNGWFYLDEKSRGNLFQTGKQQLSMLALPSHGDTVIDSGAQWSVRMNGGFVLRDAMWPACCHPDFMDGPKDAMAFAEWFNSKL